MIYSRKNKKNSFGIILSFRCQLIETSESESFVFNQQRKIEQHIPALRRYAWSLAKNQSDADDLVQETIAKALAGWSMLKSEKKLRQWMFSILHNLFLNDIRRQRTRRDYLENTAEGEPGFNANQVDQVYFKQVMKCVAKISEGRRSVLILVTIEGFSYEETARILNIATGTVMSRLSRARADLREMLEEDETDSKRSKISPLKVIK